MDVIFNIGIFLSFFLQFLLFTKKNKSLSDKVLAFWMLFIGIHLLSYYIYLQGYWEQYPHLIGVTVPFPLLHGPMLYLYTLVSLRKDKHLRKKDYLHFAPVILSYLYMSRFYFFYSIERKIMVDRGEVDDFGVFTAILLIAYIVSGLTYSILAYRLVGKHKRLIDRNFSYDENINLNWVKYCIWGIGVIFATATLIIVLREGMGIAFSFNADYIFYSLIIIFVFCIGFFGIRQKDIFTHNLATEDVKVVDAPPQDNYKKSGLKEEVAMSAHIMLLEVMEEQKPYLEPKLTLSSLAEIINVSPNHLSQIINQYENVNFRDFVNRFRVEEFEQRAAENSNFSILALAFDSGFNSKSSFNNVFKKHKGITPSQYMSSVKNHIA